MPVHDWTRVPDGIFQHFHHQWISAIQRALNRGLLPDDYYALAEQHAAGFGPDVLTLQGRPEDTDQGASNRPPPATPAGAAVAAPRVRLVAESDRSFSQRRRSTVTVRHVSGDRIVAMVEIVSPGNESSRPALWSFVEKASELLMHRVHLLVLDLHPPGPRDPHGIHAAIWEDFEGQESKEPLRKPLVLAAYESALTVRAYVETLAVGDDLPEMPLFLDPPLFVNVPLEATYRAAFDEVPRRWRRILENDPESDPLLPPANG